MDNDRAQAQQGPTSDRPTLGEIQRARILDAVVAVVAERGAAGTSVGLAIARAGVSSRTFYEYFDGLDECLVAVMERGLEQVASLAARAFTGERAWQDGMRAALAAVLSFFDSEPELARVLIVETPAASPVVRERRERVNEAFRELVVEQIQGEVSHPSALAPEALFASVLGVVHARMTARESRPLIELLGPLMGIVVGSFMDEAQAAREVELGDRLAQELLAERAQASGAEDASGASASVPPVLRDPRAHRARMCLCYIASQGGRGSDLSNREVGAAIGISHRGQLAALLAQLLDLGLLSKQAGAPGHPNAWRATSEGEIVARAIERDGTWTFV
jgi:AcrR family transcriptional regulator